MEHQLAHHPIEHMVQIGVRRRREWMALRVGNALAALSLWVARHRTRRSLGSIADDPRLLDDIGIAQAQARREAAKWFWTP